VNLKKPFLVLAPMDDVTDMVFRHIVAECAPPDLFFTEFVNVDGLMSVGRAELIKKLKFSKSDSPLIVQLWGKDPNNFYQIARQLADGTIINELKLPKTQKYAGIDLNMGCPIKAVVKNGACSALMNNRDLAKDIIDATREASKGLLPISVKTRIGFNEIDYSWIQFLLSEQLSMLTIHARTRKEQSKVPANWETFVQIKQLRDQISPTTLLVGNGDVASKRQALDLIEKYQIDGIMIGRGVLNDPFAFAETSPWETLNRDQKINLYKKHIENFNEAWPNGERSFRPLKKFCKLYINKFEGASDLREHIVDANNMAELINSLNQ
jgi:tRNA-dihydrouridine synthase